MRLGHPNTRKLKRWLDGEEPSIDGHVGTCAHCADRLEPLVDDSETLIGPALSKVLRMPDEMPERLQRSLDGRMSARDDLTLFSELFGLPIRAVRVMSTTGQGER